MQLDVDFASAALGKGVLEGIAQQLIENEPAGDCSVNIQDDQLDLDPYANALRIDPIRLRQLGAECVDIARQIEPGEIV